MGKELHAACPLAENSKGGQAARTCRLSLNGVSVRLANGHLLGVGHIHRGYGDTLRGKPLARNLTYFAHHYTHYFYLQEPDPPAFRVRKLGSEFCIGTERGLNSFVDCEVVQYVTGLVLREGVLTLAYGVNDCMSKMVDFRLSDVLDDLKPPDRRIAANITAMARSTG